MKQLYLILLLINSINLYAQDRNTILFGKVISDSLAIENVHIINLSSNRGSLSNQNGKFKISVKENDTLRFSDIQFLTKEIIITNRIIAKNYLIVLLRPKNNELDEIVLTESKNMAKALGLPNADKKPLNKLERNLNHYSQASIPVVILAALIGQRGGIDDIYNIISGNRKKDRKLKKLQDDDKKSELNQEYVQSIRNHFQDDFFIETLLIPKEKIDTFINYCIPKNIIYFFNKRRNLEIMDIFIAESKIFNLLD